jgi:hypothetical protein
VYAKTQNIIITLHPTKTAKRRKVQEEKSTEGMLGEDEKTVKAKLN